MNVGDCSEKTTGTDSLLSVADPTGGLFRRSGAHRRPDAHAGCDSGSHTNPNAHAYSYSNANPDAYPDANTYPHSNPGAGLHPGACPGRRPVCGECGVGQVSRALLPPREENRTGKRDLVL